MSKSIGCRPWELMAKNHCVEYDVVMWLLIVVYCIPVWLV